ncbi:hypothetical protein EJ03DRAFT_47904 [Teratosphaeria nubilosa]|uniref:Uncharacterized protein n=1 Tax=Teratosphaeria nubilosa TaxID=161662 RepID=A0A6G1KTM1_9PEZI|nr:hypothetical protein EJ03DRAFT_47904 [Teratosphaeria nubilosa]
MLLTISQPTRDFGTRFTHDFSPRVPLLKSRVSSNLPPKADPPVNSLRASGGTDEKMTTPHRGLPPPSAMNLPDPRERQAPPPLGQPLGGPLGIMPQPPSQWHGQEESMRNWLAAKAEEDKRKQEEERTKQEGFRLEQRRIEQAMLRESLQAGVPPSMVPMIYVGMGGANLANVSLDWLQSYAAQLQATQQQIQQQASPELRRETRLISQAPAAYAPPVQQPIMPTQQSVEQPQLPPNAPLQTTFSVYQPGPPRDVPASGPRSVTHSQLPRLTTNEMHIYQPPPNNPGSVHPLQQSQTVAQEPTASSPSIYFHHWVPPNEQKNQPQTPASKSGEHPVAHLPESDYRESPRKRKAQGGHERNPPPSSVGPARTSPSFSTISSSSRNKSGHARTRSNASARDAEGRPGEMDPPRASRMEQHTLDREREEQGSRDSSQQLDPGSGSGRSNEDPGRPGSRREGR